MRVLLALLLCATLLQAEETFGPVALSRVELTYFPVLRFPSADTLLYLWGSSDVDSFPGFGQRLLLNGTPAGPRLRYDNWERYRFSCPAEMDVLELPGGGEVWQIGHA
jgi:hypothetical protein